MEQIKDNMKKLLFFSLLFFVPFVCFAMEGMEKISALLENIQNAILQIGGGLGVLMIIIGGAIYMTARDDANQARMGLNTVKYTLIGVVIILFSSAFLAFINSLVE